MSLLTVACCHIEVSGTGRSLVRRNPTDCGMSECCPEISTMRRPRSIRAAQLCKKRHCEHLLTL